MFFKKLIPALLTIIFTASAFAKDPIRTFDACTVTKVSDGDTITANCSGTKIKVRLYGIDAPETEKMNRRTGLVLIPGQPYGKMAERALKNKIGGQTMKVDVMDIDKYKRLVSLV